MFRCSPDTKTTYSKCIITLILFGVLKILTLQGLKAVQHVHSGHFIQPLGKTDKTILYYPYSIRLGLYIH